LNGILYDGSYKTAWNGFNSGLRRVWRRISEALIAKGYSMSRLSLNRVAVDSTTVEARKEALR